jgi:hypothetical protein
LKQVCLHLIVLELLRQKTEGRDNWLGNCKNLEGKTCEMHKPKFGNPNSERR